MLGGARSTVSDGASSDAPTGTSVYGHAFIEHKPATVDTLSRELKLALEYPEGAA